MAIAQIDRLAKQSGGFGAYLMMAHNWADRDATRTSYELIARHVMPQFQGQARPMLASAERAREARPELAAAHGKAVEDMAAKYQEEVQSRD